MRMTRLAALLGAVLLSSTPALGQGWRWSGNVGITSNYMSRGVTQSGDRPALSFGLEAERSGFYAGLWGSSVRLAPDNLELDLYAGYRFSVGTASFDIGYARYLYDSSGDCCGEVYGLFEVAAAPVTVFGGLYWDPSARSANDLHLGLRYGFLDRFEASAQVGRAAGGINYGVLGLAWQFNESVSFDAGFHVTDAQPNRLVVSTQIGF